MGKIVRTARGELIDLDILKMKQSIGNKPKPPLVKEREEFVDQKLHRKIRRAKVEQAKVEADIPVEEPVDSPQTQKRQIKKPKE